MATALAGTAAAATILGADTDAKTSPLVTRPSLPVPVTDPAAIWLSAISLAAAGIATPAMLLDAAGAVGTLAVAAAGAA